MLNVLSLLDEMDPRECTHIDGWINSVQRALPDGNVKAVMRLLIWRGMATGDFRSATGGYRITDYGRAYLRGQIS